MSARASSRSSPRTSTADGPTSLSLGFGFDQYFALAAAGFLGTLPVASWLGSLSTLAASLPTLSGAAGAAGAWMGGALVVLALVILLVAPPLVPCLVLRARQPRGASISCDDRGVVEREGAWQRASIPWSNAEAARVTWEVPTRLGTRTCTAIQVFDRTTDDVITAWEDRPPGAPLVRRRLVSSRATLLADALERRRVRLDRHADWNRVVDANRVRPSRAALALTRLGYVGGALAPILAFPAPAWGVAIGAASSVLLAWRARCSVAEALALRARLAARAVAPRPAASDGSSAEKARLRAVTIEVTVRVACAVLPLAASLVNALLPAP
jgi:hypothetical protein